MKNFFLYIKNRIETRIPTLKVELFNDQFNKANIDRNEKAIRYPICYVEFIIDDVNNLAMGIKDYFLIVRFRLGVEGYKFQRLETFDFVDEFYQAVHLMRPTDDSGLIFSSFQEAASSEFDEDHNNVERPYIDYRTKYRSQVAYKTPVKTVAPTTLVVNIELKDPPIFYEAQELKPVYFYEDTETPVYFRECNG